MAEAQALANQAAQQLGERFRAGDYPPKHWGYYPNRPFREQVLQEIRNDAGEVSTVVTRNSYGCLVLNTARVMFVDIDLPEPKHLQQSGALAVARYQSREAISKMGSANQTSSVKWCTCEFLRQIGNSSVHPEVQTVLTLHDDSTRAGSKLQLACTGGWASHGDIRAR